MLLTVAVGYQNVNKYERLFKFSNFNPRQIIYPLNYKIALIPFVLNSYVIAFSHFDLHNFVLLEFKRI